MHAVSHHVDAGGTGRAFCTALRHMPPLLPCRQSRDHLAGYLEVFPPERATRMSAYVLAIHNAAARKSGGRIFTEEESDSAHGKVSYGESCVLTARLVQTLSAIRAAHADSGTVGGTVLEDLVGFVAGAHAAIGAEGTLVGIPPARTAPGGAVAAHEVLRWAGSVARALYARAGRAERPGRNIPSRDPDAGWCIDMLGETALDVLGDDSTELGMACAHSMSGHRRAAQRWIDAWDRMDPAGRSRVWSELVETCRGDHGDADRLGGICPPPHELYIRHPPHAPVAPNAAGVPPGRTPWYRTTRGAAAAAIATTIFVLAVVWLVRRSRHTQPSPDVYRSPGDGVECPTSALPLT